MILVGENFYTSSAKIAKTVLSFFPKNSDETKKATLRCSKIKGPTFISLKTDKMLNNW